MKTKKYFLALLSLVLIMFVVSCDNDDDNSDTEAPEIYLISPVNEAELQVGDTILFEARFSDNVGLASYRVNIHSNSDGHGHSRAASTEEGFTYNKSWSLTGKEMTVNHQEIVISEEATPGEYHMMVFCADHVGNETYIVINLDVIE